VLDDLIKRGLRRPELLIVEVNGGKKPDRRLHPVQESHFFLFDED
jgi:hypothetical protein